MISIESLVVFWVLGGFLIACSLAVVTFSNILYSGLSMLILSASLAIIYIWMGQEYFGAMQLLIYSGAIMVLILFMIMLLNDRVDRDRLRINWRSLAGAAISIGIFVMFYPIAMNFSGSLPPLGNFNEAARDSVGSSRLFAEELYFNSILAIELVALTLLLGVVGAITLAKRERH